MKTINITGLGCGGRGDITLRTLDTLKSCDIVYLRTEIHPSISDLADAGIRYTTFDHLYEECSSFDEVYENIARTLVNENHANIGYVIPGSAVFFERSVSEIIQRTDKDIKVNIIPSISFIDGIFSVLKIDAAESFKLIDAVNLTTQKPDTSSITVVCQVYDRETASDVKLELMKYYDDETMVYLVTAAGCDDEIIENIPLYEIDRSSHINHLTTLVIPAQDMNSRIPDPHLITELLEKVTCKDNSGLQEKVSLSAETVKNAIEANDEDLLYSSLSEAISSLFILSKACKNQYCDIHDLIKGINMNLLGYIEKGRT